MQSITTACSRVPSPFHPLPVSTCYCGLLTYRACFWSWTRWYLYLGSLNPPPPSPTDIIGANVTEFSLDRPQRSWPMQLEGLGSRLVGIGISDNWQPIESKRDGWLQRTAFWRNTEFYSLPPQYPRDYWIPKLTMHTQLQLATQKYRRGRVVSLATPRSSTGMAIASLMDMNPYNLISANSRKRIKPGAH